MLARQVMEVLLVERWKHMVVDSRALVVKEPTSLRSQCPSINRRQSTVVRPYHTLGKTYHSRQIRLGRHSAQSEQRHADY